MEMQKFSSDIVMPETYYIAFEAEKEKGIITRIAKAKDEQGNFYYQKGEKKRWFVRRGTSYRSYFLEGNGMCVLESDKDYALSHVEEVTKEFQDCIQKSTMLRIGKAELRGCSRIAGRDCEEYAVKVKVKAGVFSQEFLCGVDQTTKSCLRWKHAANLNGFVVTPAGSFECVEFLTDHIGERLALRQEVGLWGKS